MSILRSGLNILITCVIIIIVAVTALYVFVDPNRLKPYITETVRKQTGYQLDIDGNLGWSVYPRIGVEAESMQITAPQEKHPFIIMQNAVLGMDFLQLLRGKSNLSGDVHIKYLTLGNMHAENVTAEIAWEDNVLTLSPVSATLYDGWMSATVHARDLTKTPHWDWDAQFSRIQLKSLLLDLSGKDSKLMVDGTGQLRMEAVTSGSTKSDVIKHMQGNLSFSLTNGTVTGIDLNYLVNTAAELIQKQPVSPPADISQTAFESLTGTMKIKQSVASSDNTILVTSAFTVKAAGSIDLTRQFIDYNLNVVPQQLEKYKWGIPVIVIGDLQSPTVKLDMLKLNTIIANEQFQQLKEKAENKLKELSPKVDNFLQRVFGH